jgi:hypothetical protein
MSASATTTTVITAAAAAPEVITVRLRRRKPRKDLAWGHGIPDNEFMGKKSSKRSIALHHLVDHFLLYFIGVWLFRMLYISQAQEVLRE